MNIRIIPLLFVASGVYAQSPATLQAEITELKAALARQSTIISSLQTTVVSLQRNPALALGPFVAVDPNPENNVIGPNIVFKGANVHIVSGSGATDDHGNLTQLGNLFIGYNEATGSFGRGLYTPPNSPRKGSHNLIIGRFHSFVNTFGCVMFGWGGLISTGPGQPNAEGNTILGGSDNDVSSQSGGVVVGGIENYVNSGDGVVVGGQENIAGGTSVTLGGYVCTAAGNGEVALGGFGLDKSNTGGEFSVSTFDVPVTTQ